MMPFYIYKKGSFNYYCFLRFKISGNLTRLTLTRSHPLSPRQKRGLGHGEGWVYTGGRAFSNSSGSTSSSARRSSSTWNAAQHLPQPTRDMNGNLPRDWAPAHSDHPRQAGLGQRARPEGWRSVHDSHGKSLQGEGEGEWEGREWERW